ncbi:MAG: transketolase [Elusimicrobiota bacterium]
METAKLEKICQNVRKNIISMLAEAGSGHPGGSLSSVELLVALYFTQMKFDPSDPQSPDRDYFILSKGHVCPVLYAVLSQLGCIGNDKLCTLRKQGSCLQGHPARDKEIPGIEVSTGSLGYGLSVGVGTALASRMAKKPNRSYVLMGDGEQQEGSIWEAVMSAGHYKLDNLCGIVDWNNLQIDGNVDKVMNIMPIVDKYKAFNWNTIEIDGHDLKQVVGAYEKAKDFKGKPTVIIAKTIKGKGVSFMENNCDWHGKTPNKELTEKALKEIGGN